MESSMESTIGHQARKFKRVSGTAFPIILMMKHALFIITL